MRRLRKRSRVRMERAARARASYAGAMAASIRRMRRYRNASQRRSNMLPNLFKLVRHAPSTPSRRRTRNRRRRCIATKRSTLRPAPRRRSRARNIVDGCRGGTRRRKSRKRRRSRSTRALLAFRLPSARTDNAANEPSVEALRLSARLRSAPSSLWRDVRGCGSGTSTPRDGHRASTRSAHGSSAGG